jgi:hypothetical protein
MEADEKDKTLEKLRGLEEWARSIDVGQFGDMTRGPEGYYNTVWESKAKVDEELAALARGM